MGDACKDLMTYTPKPAIGLLEGTSTDVLFVDHKVIPSTNTSSSPASELVRVKLFPRGALTTSNVELINKQAYNNNGGHVKIVKVVDADDNVPHAEVTIWNSRELTILGHRLINFAKSIGTEGQAVILTSAILSQYFDLTVPSYIVDLANEETEKLKRYHSTQRK